MKDTKAFYYLFPVLLVTMLWNLGNWGVVESSEARYAEIAREMMVTGNWLKPQLLGIYHFDKPLVTYWIAAAGMKLFGVGAFGARFFLQIAYLLQIFLVFKITEGLFASRKKAFYAAIIYAGLPLVLMSVRNLTTDAFLNTFELLAVFLLIRYYRQRQVGWLYLFFIVLGLAIFTKGPVGIIMPVLMIYPVRQILQVEGRHNKLHLGFGILLTLLIGSSWFIFLMLKSPEFYNFFVGEQLVDRMFKASALKRAKPFWYYWAFFPATLLPAFFLLVGSVFTGIRHKVRPLNLVLLFGLLIPLLFFSSSSSKLVLYVLPLAPYAALAAGWFIDEKPFADLKKYYVAVWGFYLLLLAAFSGLFLGLVPNLNFSPTIGSWFFLAIGFIMLGWFVANRNKRHLVFLALVLPLSIAPVSTYVMGQMEIEINATRPIAKFLQRQELTNRQVIVWDIRLPSLSFALQKEIYSVYHHDFSLQRHTEFQENNDWQKNLINVNNTDEAAYLRQLLASSAVLIVENGNLPADFAWVKEGLQKQQDFGKWQVYY